MDLHPSIKFASTHLIYLGGERYCEGKVSHLRRTQCIDQDQPGPLDPEPSTLTIRPVSFHMHYTDLPQNHLGGYNHGQKC